MRRYEWKNEHGDTFAVEQDGLVEDEGRLLAFTVSGSGGIVRLRLPTMMGQELITHELGLELLRLSAMVKDLKDLVKLAFVAEHPRDVLIVNALKMGFDPRDHSSERLRCALSELVELKRIKDEEGKTDDYEARQPVAWEVARQVLEESHDLA